VRVTEKSVFGNGLFGNDNVVLSYFNVGTLNLQTGHGSDSFQVLASQTGAAFTSQINITDVCQGTFTADVIVDSGSHLNLTLVKVEAQSVAALTVEAVNGNVVLPGRIPLRPVSGTADVFFGGVLGSQIAFVDFTSAVGVQV
jgi:hypothetical protein